MARHRFDDDEIVDMKKIKKQVETVDLTKDYIKKMKNLGSESI